MTPSRENIATIQQYTHTSTRDVLSPTDEHIPLKSVEVSASIQRKADILVVPQVIETIYLPSEVVDYILEILAQRTIGDPGDVLDESVLPPAVEVDRHELGTLSLICRYWAKRTRPHLFRQTTIRSLSDLNSLIQIIQHTAISDLPPVIDCLRIVNVLQSGAWSLPWLHHVYSRLSELTIHHLSLSLFLDDTYVIRDSSNPDSTRFAPRSLSTHLPRTIPGDSYHFQTLELSNLRFRRVADLLSLLHHATIVQNVACRNVQFEDANIPIRGTAPRRAPERGLFIVAVSRCGQASFEVDLAFAILATKSAKRCGLEAGVWMTISKIVLSMFPSGDGWNKRLAVLSIQEGIQFSFILCYRDKTNRAFSAGIEFQFEAEEGPTMTHIVSIGLGQVGHAAGSNSFISSVNITVHEERQASLEQVKSWNWSLLDEVLSALTHSPIFLLKIECKQVFKWLLAGVADHKVLARTYHSYARSRLSGEIDIRFAGNTCTPLSKNGSTTSIQEVLQMSSEYPLGTRMVPLTVCQRFELLFCRFTWEKQFFLLRALHLVDSGLVASEGDTLRASLSDNDSSFAGLDQDALLLKAAEVFGSVDAFIETCQFPED